MKKIIAMLLAVAKANVNIDFRVFIVIMYFIYSNLRLKNQFSPKEADNDNLK